MNRPPHDFIRIPLIELRSFAVNCLKAAGLRPDHADQLGKLLSNSDLCGVRSHGTRQVGSYCPMLRDGLVNPDPELTVFKETANPDEVRQSNDNMVRGVRETMEPVRGHDEATLPGTIEDRKAKEYTTTGVPIAVEDLERLTDCGRRLGVEAEWNL